MSAHKTGSLVNVSGGGGELAPKVVSMRELVLRADGTDYRVGVITVSIA